ncbi:YopJ/AvrA family T3SS effector serine/threonine acetyltransferase [Bartonella quintana]|uniref:Hypothetical intracellular effector n=1 Tax=Bartonella quintana (strain Toulouse) TaxID=283165 RepID=A0A0H3LWL4_BARQU|nr:YopJ/AvrA family T3SS effector serine/threonine acetyltransferase [Bartonella quintana]QUG72493.1 YopJ family type III secretion system effector serine/threonine acetyltransferase [Bartonella quintana]CAF26618.1 hypothetical intracellular effector [Bartonella quintana str. Toulouse]
MKPQNSNSTPHHSFSTQNSDIENESLESLLARLENEDSEKVENEDVSVNHEKLKGIITDLESDLASGKWINAFYANIDLKMMPALVKQANTKYPEMNLKLALTPQELVFSIKETINSGVQSSRFIVNLGGSRIHFAVIDHQTVADKTSLLLLEPTSFENGNAAMMGLRTKKALQDSDLSHYSFSMAEMNIQRSTSECGIFSLALAKKLYLESDKLKKMHTDNVNGVLSDPESAYLSSDKLDQYLPITLYKHTQSTKRLKQYVKANPGSEHKSINKKEETLFERFEKNLTLKEDKAFSVSTHKKRISEYKSLLNSI